MEATERDSVVNKGWRKERNVREKGRGEETE